MNDALGLQIDLPELPDEQKASKISVALCTRSYHSGFMCYAK
jgi:hypothetical protein